MAAENSPKIVSSAMGPLAVKTSKGCYYDPKPRNLLFR